MAHAVFFLSVFLVLFHGFCNAQLEMGQQNFWQRLQQQQQHSLRAKTSCDIQGLSAEEPTRRQVFEAGRTEYWDRDNDQFECAGVAAVRNVIESKGLLLPHYNNAPQILYVIRGNGLFGTVIPGCAETYESSLQGSGQGQKFFDRHQKIGRLRQGDVLAFPAGQTLWIYNNGFESLETVALLDTSNDANQLDLNFRNFFLAGTSRSQEQQQLNRFRPMKPTWREANEQNEDTNVMFGLDDQLLWSALDVEDKEIVSKIKGYEDKRGRIVRADDFQVMVPEEEQEEMQGKPGNGLEETLCTLRLKYNLANPAKADLYNPRAGRIATVNSQKLPILSQLQLSAEKGVLYGNAILAPHWCMNSHTAIYITRGSGRLQVVGSSGQLVFDDIVREGQMIIVPQNFVVLHKASDNGVEWIAFKTTDNAMSTHIAGRLSALRAMPEDVLMNAYMISREEARMLKYSRDESTLLSPSHVLGSSESGPQAKAMGYPFNVIKNMM